MSGITIYEFDALVTEGSDVTEAEGLHVIPANVFAWLERESLRPEDGEAAWLRPVRRRGRRAVQVTSFVGVVRAPDGFQIEVLPKVGKVIGGGATDARWLLLDMLRCLNGFRHIRTDRAKVAAAHMPLLEVFIGEFLLSVEHVVKRGLRSDYTNRQGNLLSLRGKLCVAPHLRENLCRADRFFTEHDEYTPNRPENRLLHAALRRVLASSVSRANQQLARELCFVFAEIQPSDLPDRDFQHIRLDRGMGYYNDALAWARLILDEESPLTGIGKHRAFSLLFPMEKLFEAFVGKHLADQLTRPLLLKAQVRSRHLVRHCGQDWFRLKPDLLVRDAGRDVLVLDAKWKLLNGLKSSGTDKYGLAQSDFYQLHAYGHNYLDGKGDVALIFPKTDSFDEPLPVFEFSHNTELRLWVLPYCLKSRALIVPEESPFMGRFEGK
ncbi:2-keto-D-gluconate dehydrogenase [Burkholderia ubonensis]|uniref:McrC family protein n=1 Tax=Burkholderia ubonensis TaxID=101571 RepID=UPI00075DA377|nr:McrC family protein [Burkholderia ubonensis]KVR24642.1 2-keto-D-gluconate dehydrogenase [Burkholderia ubonensis]KWC02167.1 2-keto-D-gluconate dehydrogenase [Burkholderia ubonensis]